MTDVLLWGVPRLILWIVLSFYPFKKAMELDNDVENRGKVAFLFFIIFFVLAPICFVI